MMNIRTVLILGFILFFINLFMLQSVAVPLSFHIKAQTTIYGDSEKMNMKIETWFANNKSRVEMKGNANPNETGMGSSVIIADLNQKIAYLLDPVGKTGLKVDLKQINTKKLLSSSINEYIMNPEKTEAEIKKLGGKKLGTESVLGYSCEVWQMNSPKSLYTQPNEGKDVVIKMWLSKDLGLVLKIEMKSASKGVLMDFKVNEIQINIPISQELFSVPGGYKITPLAPGPK